MSTSATNPYDSNNSQGFNGLITTQPESQKQMQPSYAAEYPIADNSHTFYGGMLNCLGSCVGFIGSIPVCPCPSPYKKIEQGHVGLITQFGKFYKIVDPGLIKVNLFTEHVHKVDVKIQITEIPHQYIMTKDNVYVEIFSVIYWHVVDPYQTMFGIANVRKALIERTQTTLRQTLGARILQDCIENRDAIAFEIKETIDEPANRWGVKVESILIKDIVFSKELQESLSTAAQQKRIGESKVIAAQAEVDAAKLMKQAAELLNSPAAMQIRYLETMSSMSKASGTKVIFMPYSTNDGSNKNLDIIKASVYEQIADQKN
ncbi:unnamed protein product [Rhizophagus irregularis]|nr:unnamed protein product [Rhizophagus irregularis]CAB4417301.1 unnamed protein product [Rhizophagus irregularis]